MPSSVAAPAARVDHVRHAEPSNGDAAGAPQLHEIGWSAPRRALELAHRK
jgi:hypothetical protein